MNWQTFKALHELSLTGRTKYRKAFETDATIQYYIKGTKELILTKSELVMSDNRAHQGINFKNTFDKQHNVKFNTCLQFLESFALNTPQCKHEVEDILILSEIKDLMDSGELDDIRTQIMESKETRRGVSLMFFKHEKYLDHKDSLESALKLVLNVDSFADDRDAQYLYVLHCKAPEKIVLCENLHFLKMPTIPRQNNIELWYAGGKNIDKLRHINLPAIPIYYSCDWDYDGLLIYQRVKEIIPKIILLIPNGSPRGIEETQHKSLWKNGQNITTLSGLPRSLFTSNESEILLNLITENNWIIEESNNLLEMLEKSKVE